MNNNIKLWYYYIISPSSQLHFFLSDNFSIIFPLICQACDMRCQPVICLATMRVFGTGNNSDPIASKLPEVVYGRQDSPIGSDTRHFFFPALYPAIFLLA